MCLCECACMVIRVCVCVHVHARACACMRFEEVALFRWAHYLLILVRSAYLICQKACSLAAIFIEKRKAINRPVLSEGGRRERCPLLFGS